MTRIVLLIAFAVFGLVGGAKADIVAIGQFCMEGVVEAPGSGQEKQEADGIWKPKRYRYQPGKEVGWIYVFDKPVVSSKWFEDCATMAKRTLSEGNSIVLSGRLKDLDLDGLRFKPNNGDSLRWQIPAGKFSADILSVTSGKRPVLGGTVDFAKSKAWLQNRSSPLFIEATAIAGELEIESWSRTIRGALLALPGGLTLKADLTQVPAPYDSAKQCNNTCFRLNVDTGVAKVWFGELAGPIAQVPGSTTVTLGPISAEQAALKAKQIRITFADGLVTRTTIDGMEGRLAAADLAASTYMHAMTAVDFRSNTALVVAEVDAATGALRASRSTLTGVQLSSPNASFGPRNQSAILTGAVIAKIAELAPESVTKANLVWAKPKLPAVRFMLGDGRVIEASLSIDGDLARPTVTAKVQSSGLSLGGVAFDYPLVLNLVANAGHERISLPVDVNTPAASGAITLVNEQGTVMLQGKLKALKLKGVLVVELADIAKSHLDVPKDSFSAGLGAAIALQSLVAGSKPTFGQVDLSLGNPTDLVVASQSVGTVQLAVGLMVVNNPKIKIGAQGTPATLKVDLKSEGDVELQYDLAKSRIAFASGKLSASDFAFELVDTPNPAIDLGDLVVSNPRGRLQKLLISATQTKTDDLIETTQTGELTGFEFTATRVEKPKRPNQGFFGGTLNSPFRLRKLVTSNSVRSDIIEFDNMSLEGLNFKLANADYEEVGGFHVSAASLDLKIASVVKTKQRVDSPAASASQPAAAAPGAAASAPPPPTYIEKTTVDGLDIAAQGQLNDLGDIDFTLKPTAKITLKASGEPDKLNGNGSLSFNSAAAHKRAQMIFDPRINCESGDIDEDGRLKVPMRADIVFGAVEGLITLNNGEASLRALAPALAATLISTATPSCRSKSYKWTVAAASEGWTNGICGCCFPPKIYSCEWKWSTPEISFAYHNFAGIANLSVGMAMPLAVISYKNKKTEICQPGVAPTTSGLVVLGSISPEIETPYPGASDIVNAFIKTTIGTIESAVVTGLANGALWLKTTFDNTTAACLR